MIITLTLPLVQLPPTPSPVRTSQPKPDHLTVVGAVATSEEAWVKHHVEALFPDPVCDVVDRGREVAVEEVYDLRTQYTCFIALANIFFGSDWTSEAAKLHSLQSRFLVFVC